MKDEARQARTPIPGDLHLECGRVDATCYRRTMAQLSETHLVKRGVAKLATLIVQTLNESDPSFRDRFLEKLGEAYYDTRDNTPADEDPRHELELFAWTREFLTGFSLLEGQGRPYLER
jgi:hypothetical protein